MERAYHQRYFRRTPYGNTLGVQIPSKFCAERCKGSLSMMHRRRAAVRSAVRARIQAVPWSGRWASLSPQGDFTEEELMAAALRALYRYGVITRDLCASEPLLPPWSLLYPILERMEFAGEVRRGYFIIGGFRGPVCTAGSGSNDVGCQARSFDKPAVVN